MVPSVVMRPSMPQPRSVNQSAPSGPLFIQIGKALTRGSWGWLIAYSVIVPLAALPRKSVEFPGSAAVGPELPPQPIVAASDATHAAIAQIRRNVISSQFSLCSVF